jgi:subtilisin-like proprotein convertase family protein
VFRSVLRALAPCILVATTVVLSGCSAATKVTQPQSNLNQAQSTEAAAQVGLLIFAGGTPNAAPASFVAGDASILAAVPSTRPQAAAAETTITNGDITWTLAIEWFDAADQQQANYDPQTTVRMHTDSQGAGTVTSTDGSATLGTAGSYDVLGVDAQATALTTDGTQSDTLHYTLQGPNGSVSVVSLCTGVLANVVESKPVADHYPSTGSGNWNLDVTRHFEAGGGSLDQHYSAVVTATFNGSHLVPLVVNGTWHFILDLDTGQVTPAAAS